jgi:hypothetical protein
MSSDLTSTIKELAEKDVGFYVTHAAPGGQRTVPLSTQEVIAYVEDPVGFLAKRYGVSKADYLGWHQSDYRVQCSGFTKQGARCKASVPGLTFVDSPKEWADNQTGRCALHA